MRSVRSVSASTRSVSASTRSVSASTRSVNGVMAWVIVSVTTARMPSNRGWFSDVTACYLQATIAMAVYPITELYAKQDHLSNGHPKLPHHQTHAWEPSRPYQR